MSVELRVVKRGSCGHTAAKTLLGIYGIDVGDEEVVDQIPSGRGGETSSDDVLGFVCANGLVASETSTGNWAAVEAALRGGFTALAAVRRAPPPAQLHWILVTRLDIVRGVVETACNLDGVRARRFDEVAGRVCGPVWLIGLA